MRVRATKPTGAALAGGRAAAELRTPASMSSFCELMSSAMRQTADALETSERRSRSSASCSSEASRLSRAA